MNNVDYLLRVQFSTLPPEEKLEIKRLGPHRPDDFILNQPGEKTNRNLKMEWFERKTWLTASTTKRALFCFPCLLFGNTTRTVKHESSKAHINCAMKLGLLGRVNIMAQLDSAYQRSILEHNKQAEENRYVLGLCIGNIFV